MKKIKGHSITDKLVLYMIKRLGGIDKVVKAYEATLPVSPAGPLDEVADAVHALMQSNIRKVYDMEDIIEQFPKLADRRDAYSVIQRLVREKKIHHATIGYNDRRYYAPEEDATPVNCKDCRNIFNARYRSRFNDRGKEPLCAIEDRSVSDAKMLNHYCIKFKPHTEADLQRQEDDVLKVVARPKHTWTVGHIRQQTPRYEIDEVQLILDRLYKKRLVRKEPDRTTRYHWRWIAVRKRKKAEGVQCPT